MNAPIKTSKPIYRQVSEALVKVICEHCTLGDYLPSENTLAAQYKVNRHTVRRAVDDLISAGFISRKQGKGSQVINNRIDYSLEKGRFTSTLDALGCQSESRLLSAQQIACPAKIARYLNLDDSSPVIKLETLRFVEGDPISLITHFLNPGYTPDAERLYTGGSLHLFIERSYQIELIRSQALISAEMPARDDAALLRVSLDSPLLKIESFNAIKEDLNAVVEISISRSRSDRFQIKVPTPGDTHE